MNQSKLLAGIALLSGFCAAPSVFAASDADVHGVQSAKMSLGEAIMSAQTASGGKAIYGKYDTRNGVGMYEVVVVAAGKTNTMDVDPTTGEAVKAKRDDADRTDKKGAMTIENAQVGLSQAIMTAEKQGGKALEAELDTKKDTTAYEIDVAQGDNTSTVWVDVNTGEIIKKS